VVFVVVKVESYLLFFIWAV